MPNSKPQQLQISFELAARMAIWQERVDLYASLDVSQAWELHFQEVKQRFASGSAPEREVLYVQRRFEQARGLTPVPAVASTLS